MENQAFVISVSALLVVYSAVTLYIVIKGAKKTTNLSDYALGSMFFSPIAVGLSLAASMTSAATFVINPGFIANFGWSAVLSFGIFLPLSAIISLVIMTKSFRKYGQTVKALTLAQWIGKRYNSSTFALFMAFLALLLITFIVLIVVALTKVIAGALQADQVVVMITLVVFVFGYMMFGGANSMVYTNTIQAIIMIIVALILLSSGLDFFKEGVSNFWSQLSDINPRLTENTYPESPLFRNYYEIIFAQIVVGIAIVVQPHIITKSLLLKDNKDVSKFLWTAVIVQIIFFSVVFIGFYARLTFPDLSIAGQSIPNDGIVPAYVVERFSNGLLGLTIGLFVILGLIGAGMSTLEGLVQSVSTTITSDIIEVIVGKGKLSDQKLMIVNKSAIIVLAIITILLSYDQLLQPNLSVGIFAQNGVYAYFSAAFIPVILGIFFRSIPLHIPFISAAIAALVHFGVYYVLPYGLENFNWSFGTFDIYLMGKVRNPAIASSTAILVSSIISIILISINKDVRINKSENRKEQPEVLTNSTSS